MILLVHNRRDKTSRYSHYLRELLAVEGFAAIEEIEAEDLVTRLEANPSLVLLPRTHLPEALNQRVRDYVVDGGKLLVIQPEPALAEMLGLRPTYSTVQNGVLACGGDGPLAGLPLDPVQVVVPTATYASETARPLGTVGKPDDALVQTGGIWHLPLGAGQVVAIAFDLPASVARLRHGNPDLADIPNHRWDHIQRPTDLFPGQLDQRQANVPQADVLTAILGRLIETLVPQPRLWYYPDADQRGVLVMTSDDDWSTREQFEVMTGVLKQYDATCTFYVVHSSVLDDDLIRRYEADGHVFSVHPSMPADTKTAKPVNEAQMWWVPDMVRREVERHQREHNRPVKTIRNHALRWAGYMDLAHIQAELGIRGDANYLAVGWINAGFMFGSGRLARFVEQDGAVIDHWQIPANWTEEALVSGSHSSSERFQYHRAQELTNGVINVGVNRYHTPVGLNSHPVSFATYSQPLIESNWKTARELGAPIVAADSWVEWNDARRGVSISVTPRGYVVGASQAVPRLTVLLPQAVVDGGVAGQQVIWGQTYQTVELTNLVAGETREIVTSGQPLATAG